MAEQADLVAVRWWSGNPAKQHIGNVWAGAERETSHYLYIYLVDMEDKEHYGTHTILVHRKDCEFTEF